MSFFKMLSIALTPVLDLFRRTPDHVHVERDPKKEEKDSSFKLTSTPVLDEPEFQKRKDEIKKYDFSRPF